MPRRFGADHVFLTNNGNSSGTALLRSLRAEFPSTFLTLQSERQACAQMKVYAWCAETQCALQLAGVPRSRRVPCPARRCGHRCSAAAPSGSAAQLPASAYKQRRHCSALRAHGAQWQRAQASEWRRAAALHAVWSGAPSQHQDDRQHVSSGRRQHPPTQFRFQVLWTTQASCSVLLLCIHL